MVNEAKVIKLPQKILIVNHDYSKAKLLKIWLDKARLAVQIANTWESAIYLYNQHSFDACIVTSTMDKIPGAVLLQRWMTHPSTEKFHTIFILMYGAEDEAGSVAIAREFAHSVVSSQEPSNAAQAISMLLAAVNGTAKLAEVKAIYDSEIVPLLETDLSKAKAIAANKIYNRNNYGKFLLADILFRENEFSEDGVRILATLAQNEPKNMLYLSQLGSKYLKMGEITKARTCLERADSVAPLHVDRMHQLAEVYLASKCPEDAVEKFSQIINVSPDKPDAKFSAYDKLIANNFEEHAVDFCASTSTPKELVRHYNNKGVVEAMDGKLSEAITAYVNAIKLIPGFPLLYKVYYNLALAYAKRRASGDMALAIIAIDKSIALDGSFAKAQSLKNTLSSGNGGNAALALAALDVEALETSELNKY